jgi:hypothetical protein
MMGMRFDIVQLTLKDGKYYGSAWKDGIGGKGFIVPKRGLF